MKITTLVRGSSAALSLALLGASTAQATALPLRTWVSGTGNDGNDGSRQSPCLTFAGALAKTRAGGEIDVLDSGDFGPVVIDKAIIIDGGSNIAAITSVAVVGGPAATVNAKSGFRNFQTPGMADVIPHTAITVAAGDNDSVTLRHLSINGNGVTYYGVIFTNAASLTVEDCKFQGMQSSNIEAFAGAASSTIAVQNCTISGGQFGIISGPVALKSISITGVNIKNTEAGIVAGNTSTIVSHSTICQNYIGIYAIRANTSLTSIDNILTGNTTAVDAESSGKIRLTNTDIYDNVNALVNNGGTISSDGNNRKAGNTGPATPPGTVNATVTKF